MMLDRSGIGVPVWAGAGAGGGDPWAPAVGAGSAAGADLTNLPPAPRVACRCGSVPATRDPLIDHTRSGQCQPRSWPSTVPSSRTAHLVTTAPPGGSSASTSDPDSPTSVTTAARQGPSGSDR